MERDRPLLVIAGAGSGKTATLAHRVAQLIAHGADSGRILPLTFSRRPADEMTHRVARLLTPSAAGRQGHAGATLPWSGTFHSVGARLLRDYAVSIVLDPDFVIHDREDSAALVRRGDVEQLARIAATYASQERFLTELTLDPPDTTSDQPGAPLRDEDYLILSTIHSAKGQEWTAVTLLNAVDGCLPSDLATGSAQGIEEERRRLYVAMTRAKDQLDLVVPQRFYVSQQAGLGDRHVYGSRTRFIPNALLAYFEQTSWPAPEHAGGGTPQSHQAALDLAARMRVMWR